MLVLSRKRQESIRIGDDVVITVVSIHGSKIRLGIEAPRETAVVRSELEGRLPVQAEHAKAVSAAP